MVVLVDGNAWIFRNFFAIPPIARADGLQVNAVHGCAAALWALIKEGHTHIAVIFDAGRTTFRTDAYPDYKAHRPPTPEALKPQFPLVREAVAAFGAHTVELAGYEADDLIATYARIALEAGHDVTIVSSDKDLMQLVRPGVTMWDPIKREQIDVVTRLGVPPERVCDLLALCGDAVDGVPGVDGVGAKTAAALVNQYGDLETILARAEEVKKRTVRQNLIDQAWRARLSMKLVRLVDAVPVETTIDDLAYHGYSLDEVGGFLDRMELPTLRAEICGHREAAE